MICPKCYRRMSTYYALKQFYCQYCGNTIQDKNLLHPDKVRIKKLEEADTKLIEALEEIKDYIENNGDIGENGDGIIYDIATATVAAHKERIER